MKEKKLVTNDRVYILLDIKEGKTEQVAKVLQQSRGVIMADVVDGSPDVIAVVEGTDREQLVEMTVQALNSVGDIIERIRFLPAQNIDRNKRGQEIA